MSGTAILIIFLVVCMAVGPIFMLQPSKRQRQLARYRTEAAKRGLKVRVTEFNEQSVAVYTLPWPGTEQRKYCGPELMIRKKDYPHDLHILDFWEVKPAAVSVDFKKPLTNLITNLAGSVSAITTSPEGYSMYWMEKGGDVGLDTLEQQLKLGRDALWPLVSKKRPHTPD